MIARKRSDAHVDGRTLRGERARNSVAGALLDLLGEGVPEPSMQQIAIRAGVSERLVFHHFSDRERLYAAAAEVQLGRLRPLLKPVDPALPLDRRIPAFVHARGRLFERLTPMRRATLRHESLSRVLGRRLQMAYELDRRYLRSVFGPEMTRLPLAEAEQLARALSAIASWENWDFLRRRERLSIAATEKVVERILRSLLPG